MKILPLVWQNTLDGRYRCQVRRLRPYVGKLIIRDTETRSTILSEDVGLLFDAKFGPDSSDVYDWQERSMKVVDSL